MGMSSLLVLPLLAVGVDLAFQRARFSNLRFPDAALATGLFVALILTPTVPLQFGAAAVFVAVSVRHALRLGGRPWFNPAAFGVLSAVVLFGVAPAWWVGIGPNGEVAVVLLGALLLARTPRQWRLPAAFLATYLAFSVIQHVFAGASTDPKILLLTLVDPATLFFALFMLVEPRTAPANVDDQVAFAAIVGTSAAFLPLLLPTIGVLVALIGGNVFSVVVRGFRQHRTPSSRATPRHAGGPAVPRWPLTRRVGAGLIVIVVLLIVGGSVPSGQVNTPLVHVASPGGGGGGGGGTTSVTCASDNSNIPASTLASLHQVLGPSVILSYNSATGITVFYDPVNHVTVTESDLYEDYGFAEFNGDDYAVSGCSP